MLIVSGQSAYSQQLQLATSSSQASQLNWKKEILQINIIALKVPTGGRQTR